MFTCAFGSLDIDKADTVVFNGSPVDIRLVARNINALWCSSLLRQPASQGSQSKENGVFHLENEISLSNTVEEHKR